MNDLNKTRFIDTEEKEIEVLRYVRKCVKEFRRHAKEGVECGAIAEEGMKLLDKYDAH